MDNKKDYEERPWGNYEVLKRETGLWVKRIEVKPWERLSLQKHAKRSETWVVAKGNGNVRVGNNESDVKSGTVVRVPTGELHRMTNNGGVPLVFIEIAFGDYLEEDDIIRIEDDYNRL